MPDVIQLLPDSVANQIAAGEVIQRPASVVKELVENAVDAGARKITVRVVDAGRTSIQVVDDGKGMSETDARLSFERHSTSKIRQASDLFSLHTMGFRGEALASIAAVAQVELRTRMDGDDVGTRLRISASKFIKQEPVSCPVGCNFSVESLFFNVPARRKFLKSNATELNNIIAAFERIVLVYPKIAFVFYSNDAELMNLRPASLTQRIRDVFGAKYSQDLLPLGVDTSVCRISGFTGVPQAARKKGARQFFFVNGRYMRHAYFNKAVQSAYERLVPAGCQVPYFIYFDVNPEDIDVNIHPTKTEIKFENEQAIWQILAAAVKEAVGKGGGIPSIDFDTEGKPDIPVFNVGHTTPPSAPRVNVDPQYNPFKDATHHRQPAVPDDWEKLYEGINTLPGADTQRQPNAATDLFPADTEGKEHEIAADKSPAHYQYKGRFIMTAVKSGLMIIDQHRAHLRILFDRYLHIVESRTAVPQRVLFPEAVQLPPSDSCVLERLLPRLTTMGFEITPLGGGSYTINSVPAGLEDANTPLLLQNIVASATGNDGSAASELNRSLALNLARGAAIPYGQVLSNDEMENLVNALFACSEVNYAPDGKKVLAIMPQQDIDRLLR